MSVAVLIVGSDALRDGAWAPELERAGVRVRVVPSVDEALAAANAALFDAIVLERAAVPEARALDDVVRAFGAAPVVVVGDGGTRAAVEAVRAGAADFVDAPAAAGDVAHAVEKATQRAARPDGPAEPDRVTADASLLGASRAMRQVLDSVRRVSPSVATVLLRGESGTGKELVARAIHDQGARAAGPFVKVTCAGLPESLIESELFGYEKGAFTGAAARKPGRVELAAGGTLFFDEIGDISPAMQVKLLRLLQDRQFERLGGTTTLSTDARFIAATHRDLEHMMKKGELREDLFYRLNVVPIWLPPLRARREDVPLLARHFCAVFAGAHAKPGVALAEEAVAALVAERWPGNVRQLQNFVERLVVLAEQDTVTAADVRRELAPPAPFSTQSVVAGRGASESAPGTGVTSGAPVPPLDSTLREAERKAIERALRRAGGNRTLAARLLGVGRATLYKKLEELGID